LPTVAQFLARERDMVEQKIEHYSPFRHAGGDREPD